MSGENLCWQRDMRVAYKRLKANYKKETFEYEDTLAFLEKILF